VRILIDTLGDELISRSLVGIEGRIVDISGARRELAEEMRAQIREQFDTEGQAGSGGWEPLAASTVAGKRARGRSMRILEESGDLRASLTIIGGTDNVTRITGDTFEYGTTIPYAKHHQHGTARMPRRRPAQLPEQGRRQVTRILQRHVMGEWA
jgi:phage gpG-like protein